MRFLVTALTRHPIPPDMSLRLVEGTKSWVQGYTAAGKFEQSWAFAGLPGGGGILNVDSHEELDKIVGEYPFAPFAEIQVMPLADLSTTLDRLAQQLQAMAAASQ